MSSDGWSWRAVIREVWANISAGRLSHLLTGSFFVVVLTLVVVADASAVLSADQRETELVAAGRYVTVAIGTDPEAGPAIATRRCLAIRGNTVEASGGLRFLGTGELASHPGTPFRIYAGAGRIRRALDDSDDRGGAAGISAALARQIGVGDGSTVHLGSFDGSTVRIDQRLPTARFTPSRRHEFGDIMWLVGRSTPAIDECWVEFDRAASDYGRSVVQAALAFSDSTVAITPGIDPGEFGQTPESQYADRPTRNLHPLFGLLAALPIAMFTWSRRSTAAIYRSVGASRGQTTFILAAEQLWVMTTGLVWTFAASFIVVTISQGDAAAAWPIVARGTTIAYAVAHVAAVGTAAMAASGDVTSQLKGA